MKNPKIIIVTAVCGFFLSFVTALFSRAGIGMALLRAVVSAAVCAAVVTGLLVAVRNFLLENAAGAHVHVFRTADDELEQPLGSRVNITLDDEALPAEPDDPSFDVSSIGRSIGKQPESAVVHPPEDVLPDDKAVKPAVPDEQAAAPKTKAQILAERIAQLDGESPRKKAPEFTKQDDAADPARQNNFVAASPADITAPRAGKTAPKDAGGTVFASGGLVDLPDIGELVTEGLSNGDEIISDTDFSSATKEEIAAGRKTRVEDVDTSDSKAIASAIRTLLVSG
ncbi:MAG: hypothetical protein Pg6C_13540 [Treponemataceae bacterium]|nr:MAG: hypothetical protein Pg6C_13540 [Treponemataceae bacterium]